MRVYYLWNPDLKGQWYEDHPAEVYLDDFAKVTLLEDYICGRTDKDSEALIEVR